VGGAGEALAEFEPRILGHPSHPSRSPALRAALRQGEAVALPLTAGDVLALDDLTTLTVVWPPREAVFPVADDGCLVMRIECAGRTVLLSNDAGFLAERWIGLTDPRGRVDVWVRGHHGTDLTGTPDFVHLLQPRAVVISRQWRGRAPDAMAGRWPPAVSTSRVFDQADAGAVDIRIGLDGSLVVRGFLSGDGDQSATYSAHDEAVSQTRTRRSRTAGRSGYRGAPSSR